MNKRLQKKMCPIFIIGLLMFVIFYIYPLLMNVYYSFSEYSKGMQLVGLLNYKVLFQDQFFWLALKNTLIFLGYGVSGLLVFSYGVGVLIIYVGKDLKYSKVPFLIAMLLPTAAITFTWQLLFGDDTFMAQHIFKIIAWENQPQDMIPLILLYLWKNCGYCILIFIAGWMTIEKEVYEAAEIDGAKSIQRLRYITLPLMRPSLFFAFILAIVQALKIGRDIYILYGEYPKESIYIIQSYFRQNFLQMNVQQMSSASVILGMLLMIMILIVYKLGFKRKKLKEYET
ncbi:MAG: carbohydrate ABC transporter permease [Cellulosilyticaceae bacterium]